MKNKFSIAMTLAVVMAMMVNSLAFADQVVNTIDNTIDSGLENTTIVAGGTTVVGFYIKNINNVGGDPVNSCNVSGVFPATVTFNVPSGATANPSSLVFTACDAIQNVTFSSSTPDSYDISVLSVTGGRTGGAWDTAPAAFELDVNPPPDSTPPAITPNISGTLGNNGWYTSDVTVSWSVVDNESAISSSSGCGSTTISADTAGTTLTCSATSAGGTSSQSVTIKRDATAPSISGSAAPDANGAGWNNTDVDVTFSCSDAMSGIASCGPDTSVTTEGADQSVSGTAVDNAGNSAGTTVSPISIDKTAPTISAAISPAAAGTGWYNSTTGAPTVSFSCNDTGGSGLVGSCPVAVTLGEGAEQSVSGGPVSDLADNDSNVATISNIDVDLTAPSVSLVGGPANNASYYFGSVPAEPTCSADDATSGLAGACNVSGYSAAVGTHTVTASASDNAGNSSSASATYTVNPWTLDGFYQPVDMNGVFNVVKGGSTVPFKFQVFAGSTELTNVADITGFRYGAVACDATAPNDAIETLATGETSLRYDWTSGQFIYNWKTPRTTGCFSVTMTTNDGSTLTAFFKLK